MIIEIPLRLPSVANLRMHWAVKAKLVRQHRKLVKLAWNSAVVRGCRWSLPACITLTRVGPRKLDSDNLTSAFKAVRDEIAACMGVDDGSEDVAWIYEQQKGPYEIHIEVES